MRSAVGQAGKATDVAAQTGARLGGDASGISGNLTPELTTEMLHPEGFSQQDESAMLAAGLGGAVGATSGLTGVAMPQAAASRNAGAFQASLADAARQRTKAGAGVAEDIASKDAMLKQQQRQQGEAGLEKLYGVDTSGMLDATGQEARDISAGVDASKSGWLQNATGILGTLNGGVDAYANMKRARAS